MGVLMADGAEGSIASAQLLRGTVAVDGVFLAVNGTGDRARLTVNARLLVLQMLAEPPLVRPDGVLVATVVHPTAGIDDDQLVDQFVASPVVQAPVDGIMFQYVYDVVDQVLRILIVLLGAGIAGTRLVEP